MSEDELFEKLKQELREEENKEEIKEKPKKTKRKILTEEERQKRLENLKKGRETIKANREKKLLRGDATPLDPQPQVKNQKENVPGLGDGNSRNDDILNKLVSLLDSRLPQVKPKRQYKKREPKPKEFKPLHDNTIVRTREEEQEKREKEQKQEKPKLVEKIEPTPKMTPENKPVIKKGKLSAKDIYTLAMSF